MRAFGRWLVGLATLSLLLCLLFELVVIAVTWQSGSLPGSFLVSEVVLLGLIAFTVVLLVVLLVGYLLHLSRSPMPEDRQQVWAAVLLIGTAFAMPVYWWRYIRPGRRPTEAAGSDVHPMLAAVAGGADRYGAAGRAHAGPPRATGLAGSSARPTERRPGGERHRRDGRRPGKLRQPFRT